MNHARSESNCPISTRPFPPFRIATPPTTTIHRRPNPFWSSPGHPPFNFVSTFSKYNFLIDEPNWPAKMYFLIQFFGLDQDDKNWTVNQIIFAFNTTLLPLATGKSKWFQLQLYHRHLLFFFRPSFVSFFDVHARDVDQTISGRSTPLSSLGPGYGLSRSTGV